MCISNGLDAGLMSNAVWRGVPLRELLHAAGPLPARPKYGCTASTITPTPFRSRKRWSRPPRRLRNERGAAARSSRFSGADCRAGLFRGKKREVADAVELTGPEADGFYEEQGWGPNFVIPTRSRIDQPDDFAWFSLTKSSGGIPLRGVAFAGDRGVSRVEVSLDDGQTLAGRKNRLSGDEADLGALEFGLEAGHTRRIQADRSRDRRHWRSPAVGKERGQFSGTTGFHTITVYLAA